MKKSLVSRGLFFTVATVCVPSPAHSQSMDYGALQEVFGEPVTTAATGTPQRASEVAANMTIITSDEIRQSGARDIPTILSRVPGLDILQEGAQSWDVGIRGYQQPYQPRLLVLIDGRQVFLDDYSRTQWNNLPVNIDDIRQIEVVKGASSALFGSNATGGVVNIITYSPVYDKSNVASVSIGTQNELTGDATITAPIDGLGGIKFSAGGLSMNEYGTPRPSSETVDEVTRPYHRYVAQSSIFKVNDDLQLNSEANFTQSQAETATFAYSLSPAQSDLYSVGGGADWQTPYGLIKSTNYFNHNYIKIFNSGEIDHTYDLAVSQLEDQFKIGSDNTFRALLEYRYKDAKSEDVGGLPFEYPDLDNNTYAASGTWLYQATDKVAVTNALRVERNSMQMGGTLLPNNVYTSQAYGQTFNTLAANSGVVYKATDLDTFRATYGRGVQDPSELQNGFSVILPSASGTNVNFIGNPDLKPTIVDNYELGYDRKINEILSVAKFSVYYEFNHDLTASAPSGSLGSNAYGRINEAINVGNSQGWGGEFEVKGDSPSGFRWDGSYSYQTIRDSSLVATTLGYDNAAPENHFRLLLGYTIGKWELDTAGNYVTSTDMLRSTGAATKNVENADYISFSGRIGYQVNDHATVAVSGFNINHGDLAASPYPELERQLLLTLTDKF